MNSNEQSQQGQPYIAEQITHLETATDYRGQAMGLRHEISAGFARMDIQFVRVHEQLAKIRTTDFPILLSICLTTALGTAALIVKVYGLLPSP